jgi:hypothetical protein
MATVHKLGDGYEPHVDEVDGTLIYSLPVDSSFVSVEFSFEILPTDLDVLLADPYLRAVLETVAHSVLQRSMIRGNPPVSQQAFDEVVAQVLHSTPAVLKRFIAAVDRDHNMRTAYFVEQALARRSAGGQHG